jgi:hypothetical protein
MMQSAKGMVLFIYLLNTYLFRNVSSVIDVVVQFVQFVLQYRLCLF